MALVGLQHSKGRQSRAYCAPGRTDDAPGELNLGFTAADNRETVLHNRRLLAEAVTGDAATPIAALRQFHSNLLVHATAADAARAHPRKADGQMTDEPGLLVAIQTADCIPILVADRKRRAVAAFHAGWRGTVKRIVETGIGGMRLAFGSRPEDLVAAIGPGIGACCYAVGEEVLSEFESQFAYARALFREVYDADPVRKRYPMLFHDPTRAGSLVHRPQPAPGSDRGQSPAVAGCRTSTQIDSGWQAAARNATQSCSFRIGPRTGTRGG